MKCRIARPDPIDDFLVPEECKDDADILQKIGGNRRVVISDVNAFEDTGSIAPEICTPNPWQ